MTIVKKSIGRVPQSFGNWSASFVNPKTQLAGYGKKFRASLYGCEFESLMENNTYAPAALVNGAVVPDTVHWRLVSGMPTNYGLDGKLSAETARAMGVEGGHETRISGLEASVGTGGSVDERIAAEGAKHYLKTETYTKEELNSMITTPDQDFVTVEATEQTTAVTDVLPATGSADTIYRVGNWDGTQYDESLYTEYAWNGSAYVSLSVKSQVGEVYDISLNHAGATYIDLSDALGTNGGNIPVSLRKGGMSVKFVQSSDNKYVQYRLMADGWSVDTADWTIAEEGVYADNPEFVYVKTDKKGKILWAIKTDGNIYYGAGCPQQVKDYIEERISELSLDEYENIVAFLQDFLGTDTTLKMLLDSLEERKVDKVEGKSLIDSEYAASQSVIDSPEWADVKTDPDNKILEGIKADGTKIIGGDIKIGGSASINGDTKILGNMEVSGVSYKVIENLEYLAAWLDANNKVIFGLKTDGKTYIGDADFLNEIKNNQDVISEIQAILASISSTIESLDINALLSITAVENPEFIEAKTDSEGKLLAGRTPNGAAFESVGFSTPKMSINGYTIENIEDQEERVEIITDAKGKIISYRDKNGVKHEEAGIKLSETGIANLKEDIVNTPVDKHFYLPKFGKVNIKSETFYLTADSRWNTKDDVVCIQIYDDTDANARQRLTLSYYYIKSTLTPIVGGGYDRTSVNENSVRLELFAAKDIAESNSQYFVKKITKVDGVYYLTSTLATREEGGVTIYTVEDLYGFNSSVPVNYTDSNPDQTTLTNAIEVKKVTDVPPYKAWAISKKLEHYCIADIDFGDFYSKNDVPISIKYQGSGTLFSRKRGLRLTFYKKNDYKKKDKVKIGEMVRLSGFNMKSYKEDRRRLCDPLISNIFIEMWQTRGKDAFPWNKENCSYNGATGFIKSFPIETWFGEEFYGLQLFGLKKDEKNYMLDGDDDSSGIFASGANGSLAKCFDNADHTDFEDEMMDEMSQSTADAIDELCKYTKGFTDGTIEIDGQIVDFTNSMLEERIELEDWIDYWIGLELFILWDNAFHNVILYSGQDKKKFSLFFYDVDQTFTYNGSAYDTSYMELAEIDHNMTFWEKFIDEYKDYIINRYAELRKSVLTKENITSIANMFIDNIPERVVEAENTLWEVDFIKDFKSFLNIIGERLEYLDNNYFNIKIN